MTCLPLDEVLGKPKKDTMGQLPDGGRKLVQKLISWEWQAMASWWSSQQPSSTSMMFIPHFCRNTMQDVNSLPLQDSQ
jgi:hypothetical protein